MNLKTIAFATGEAGDCYYHEWPVQAPQRPKAWLHIMHGMAEHSARYAELAAYLNQQGYHVTADDHRGHGKTAEANNNLYHFADNDDRRRLDFLCGDIFDLELELPRVFIIFGDAYLPALCR